MQRVKIVVNDKTFHTSVEVASRSKLLSDLMSLETYDGTIVLDEIDDTIFGHVLEFMRDDTYPISRKYEHRLKYFLVNYDPEMWQRCKFCKNLRVIGSKYCKQHLCDSFACSSPKGEGKGCIRHTCTYVGCVQLTCYNTNGQPYYCCSQHSCNKPNCAFPLMKDSKYCRRHS